MFQTFDSQVRPEATRERIATLRRILADTGLDAYLVPRADEHQSEYVKPEAERLKWLTGFSGSAGLAAVGNAKAALFVDGRYTVQAGLETDAKIFQYPGLARTHLAVWLGDNLKPGASVGFDPWLHTIADVQRLTRAVDRHGSKLKPLARNLVDKAWGKERPSAALQPVTPHPVKYAGRTPDEKIRDVQQILKTDNQHAVIVTLPDSIAWLFNIRGADVKHNPVVQAFAIVPAQGKAEIFIESEKITPETRAHLKPIAKLSEPDKLKARLSHLRQAGKRVRLDRDTAAFWFAKRLGKKSYVHGKDPCQSLKAIKNATEIRGARRAHLRDGGAVTSFLAWLDGEAGKGGLDEITAARRLEEFRARTNALKDIAFDTIAGSGPNGAIVHYRVNETSNRTLQPWDLFLIDSGGQYVDGTTDITRTVAIGDSSPEMRERFTLVLKGHIAIATARFPKGTRGIDLDPLARQHLWSRGLDYDHGTGHGVGSYLAVHEGPQSISRAGMAPLQPGMIVSNEPGYYKTGAYGIRIENLVLVTKEEKIAGGDRDMLGFETLTLAPIDLRLVDKRLLSQDELAWLNAYHARVREQLMPHVDVPVQTWLEKATVAI